MSELVSPYVQQNLFCSLEHVNRGTIPEKIDLKLEKTYPILSRTESQKSFIAFEKIRISLAAAGKDGIYYTHCKPEEKVIVQQSVAIDFTPNDEDHDGGTGYYRVRFEFVLDHDDQKEIVRG